MNTEEYQLFYKSAKTCFPRVHDFFTVIDNHSRRELTDEEYEERHRLWKTVFLPLELEDCYKALEMMQAGVIAGPGFDASDFPAKIRAQAREFAGDRVRERARINQREKTYGGSMADGLRVKASMQRDVAVIIARAEEIFAAEYPDLRLKKDQTLNDSKQFRQESYRRWKQCVSLAMEELYPDADHPPTLDATGTLKISRPLLQGVN